MSDRERTEVGECPDCGYVHGDDVDLNFPNPATCSCGEELLSVRLADAEKVRQLSTGSGQGGHQ